MGGMKCYAADLQVQMFERDHIWDHCLSLPLYAYPADIEAVLGLE